MPHLQTPSQSVARVGKGPEVLLPTKWHLPALKAGTLFRKRLIDIAANNLETKLLLITGDAGYGKTTLLIQIRDHSRLPGVYLTLDANDGDFAVFYSYLVRAIERFQPGLASHSAGLAARGEATGANCELAMGTLIRELAAGRREELFLFFDDYHALPNESAVHRALVYFIDHMPGTVHAVIASRTEPPLSSLAEWQSKRDLFMLTREDLRFTADEVRALIADVCRLTLPEEELRRLHERTEGWITGIQMILLHAGRGGRTVKDTLNGHLESHQPLFNYFANAIMAAESPDVRRFMEHSSLFETLTGQACDEILHRKGSKSLLEDIERRNLFVVAIGSDHYRFHHLFNQFLQERARLDKEAADIIHRRAGDYYRETGQLDQAIEHYLKIGCFEQAGELIAAVADYRGVEGHLSKLERWLSLLPETVYTRWPRLWKFKGNLLMLKGSSAEAEDCYQRAEACLTATSVKDKESAATLADILSDKGGYLERQGQFAESLSILRRALRYCPPDEPDIIAFIHHTMGLAWLDMGNFDKALTCFTKAGRIVRKMPITDRTRVTIIVDTSLADLLDQRGERRNSFKIRLRVMEYFGKTYHLNGGLPFYNAARTALDLGRIDLAAEWLERGWILYEPYEEDTGSKASLRLGFGLLYTYRADWDLARKYMEEARQDYIRMRWQRAEAVVLKSLTRLARWQGNYRLAWEYLGAFRQLVTDIDSVDGFAWLLEKGLIEAAQGNAASALKTLALGAGSFRRFFGHQGSLLASLAATQALSATGRNRPAARQFLDAVRIARDKGFDGLLTCEIRASPHLQRLKDRCQAERTYLFSLAVVPAVTAGVDESKSLLSVKLFGGLRVSLPSGQAIPLAWRSRKVASLFAYLLLNRRRLCHREELAEMFWPRQTLKAAKQNLYLLVFRLKNAFASGLHSAGEKALAKIPLVVRTEGGYQLSPDLAFRVDAEEMEDLWHRTRAKETDDEGLAAVRRCLELYQGDFLPHLGEHWAEEKRFYFEKLYLAALRKTGEWHYADHDFETSVSLFNRYLKRDPYCDEVRIGLWRALRALGHTSKIMTDYKEFRKLAGQKSDEEIPAVLEEAYHDLTQ